MPEQDPLWRSRAAVRRWLRYQDPAREAEVRVKVARYGERAMSGEGEAAPIDALRNAQMHHAANQLPTPMMRDAVVYRRHIRQEAEITSQLGLHHGVAWLEWRTIYPVHPLAVLMVEIIDTMAEVLGEDPY